MKEVKAYGISWLNHYHITSIKNTLGKIQAVLLANGRKPGTDTFHHKRKARTGRIF